MKKQTKRWLVIVVIIIIISNLPPINYFFQECYTYQNNDGSFKYTEDSEKGLDYEVGQIRWNRFQKCNSVNPNKTLYRTFTLKPWRFWEWWNMLSNAKRFDYPYINVTGKAE
jgi:hypothetical protein